MVADIQFKSRENDQRWTFNFFRHGLVLFYQMGQKPFPVIRFNAEVVVRYGNTIKTGFMAILQKTARLFLKVLLCARIIQSVRRVEPVSGIFRCVNMKIAFVPAHAFVFCGHLHECASLSNSDLACCFISAKNSFMCVSHHLADSSPVTVFRCH